VAGVARRECPHLLKINETYIKHSGFQIKYFGSEIAQTRSEVLRSNEQASLMLERAERISMKRKLFPILTITLALLCPSLYLPGMPQVTS
jgi:hypothetical protein